MRAFVTGSTGFIGQHLVRELLAHDYSVAALVRTFERARQLPRGVRVIPGDVTKPESLRAGLREADVVFHCAGLHAVGVRPRDYPRVQRINVDGARNVLEQAAEAGVPRIVYVTCVAVLAEAAGRANGQVTDSAWQRSQRLAHSQVVAPLQERGAPLVVACAGTTYGPGDLSPLGQKLRQHARGRLWVMAGPEGVRSWTYVEDVAAGLRLTAERGRAGETYPLAGPAHSVREFFQACSRASGAPAPLIWLPASLPAGLARLVDGPLPSLAERLRAAAGGTYRADPVKAERELGWRARPLAEGLPLTFARIKET